MPDKKHFVYSARTTEKGLALLNKTKGSDKSWDQFINDAVAGHYDLDLAVIALPPSKFLEEQKAKREAKVAEKAAAKVAKDKAAADKAKAKAEAKKAADKEKADKAKQAAKDKKAKEDKATKEKAAKAKKTAKPAEEAPNTTSVTVNPGETVETTAGERVHASADNTGPVEIPTQGEEVPSDKRRKALKAQADGTNTSMRSMQG